MTMDRQDESPATKGDLRSAINEFRNKDLKELKSDVAVLKEGQRSLAIKLVKTHARIDHLDESFSAKLSDGVSRILNTVDGFMAQTQKVDRHQIITSYRVDELEKRVKTLESR